MSAGLDMPGAPWMALPAAIAWLGVLLAPWRPWSTRERIEPTLCEAEIDVATDAADVTVLIPARNEAEVIGRTLAALAAQGVALKAVVIDDQSSDGTAAIARAAARPGFEVEVVEGRPLPEGWAGKLWALEQGRAHVATAQVLLLDADIALEPGMLTALLAHKRANGAHFVSLMADLRRTSFWDRLLLPAFVYFFKLLYPFALANDPRVRFVAAAAGGCVLVDAAALHAVGAFASLRGALIDDCTLAAQIKRAGFRTWTGLSRGVVSLRPYGSYRAIHDMVARSAFTQLHYSTLLLLALTAVFVCVYWLPIAALFAPGWLLAVLAFAAMIAGYLPTLRYYGISPVWALLLPLTAALYLAMTWSSALRCWRGVRSRWKGRVYAAAGS